MNPTWKTRATSLSISPFPVQSHQVHIRSFPKSSCRFHYFQRKSHVLVAAKRRSTQSEPVLTPAIAEEVDLDEDDGELVDDALDDFEDDELVDGDEDEFEFEDEDVELHAGDGAAGGGIKFAGNLWDKEALALVEDVCKANGDLKIYAFKTLANFTIQVRIEKLSNKSGSPSMIDIEDFSSSYRTRLDEAELAGSIPNNISLTVSSPGVERVVRIPQDLDRFKERPMYVKYADGIESTESDGIFRLVSYDLEQKCCIWGIADVRLNREKAGKGRPLSKKQRGWRLNTNFDSLRLVRIYSDI